MENPILVEVTRNGNVESWHRGAFAVVNAAGQIVAQLGNIEENIFPRSAIKALQAIPLVESGTVDALGLSSEELALACASHNGESAHRRGCLSILDKAGYDESVLECGNHWPELLRDQKKLILEGREPTASYNNCSGKHAGFIALAKHLGLATEGYVNVSHPVMKRIRTTLEEMLEHPLGEEHCGTDGCSIPTYSAPLHRFAYAFSKFVSGNGLSEQRAIACKRIFKAVVESPFMVAGTDRFCTDVMKIGASSIYVKTGAEGVFCACLPKMGLGIALKCDDGAARASESMISAVLLSLIKREAPGYQLLSEYANKPLKNWNGLTVGHVTARPIIGRVLDSVI